MLGLTGTHMGCDSSSCGVCVVALDGDRAVKSCTMFAVQADGHEVMTVEGLEQGGKLHPLQQGFWDQHGLQCGYCTPGMLMTSYVLLKHSPSRAKPKFAKRSPAIFAGVPVIRTSSKPCGKPRANPLPSRLLPQRGVKHEHDGRPHRSATRSAYR